jgi:hypothetical protein
MANQTVDINFSDSWTNDIEFILDKIRINCVILSKYHKKQYYKYKGYLKYFRIPTIVLSAVSSIVSVGLKPYFTQNTISISVCLMGLIVGIINSLELFLTIQTIMEKSLTTSKEFYLLSIEIYKILLLEKEHRFDKGRNTLIECYNNYCKLIESAELMGNSINDKLLPINPFKIFSQDRYPKEKEKSIKRKFKSIMSPGLNKHKTKFNDNSKISFNNEQPICLEKKSTNTNTTTTDNIDIEKGVLSQELELDEEKSNISNAFNDDYGFTKNIRSIEYSPSVEETGSFFNSERETSPTQTELDISPEQTETLSSTQTETSPTQTDTSPTQTDTSPTQTDTSPTQTDTSPTQTDISPTQTDTSPTQTDTSPTQTETDTQQRWF